MCELVFPCREKKKKKKLKKKLIISYPSLRSYHRTKMALVEVNTEVIGDLDREVDLSVKEVTRELQTLDRELNDAHKEKGLLDTALMLSELQIIKLKDYNRLNAAKPDPEVRIIIIT